MGTSLFAYPAVDLLRRPVCFLFGKRAVRPGNLPACKIRLFKRCCYYVILHDDHVTLYRELNCRPFHDNLPGLICQVPVHKGQFLAV